MLKGILEGTLVSLLNCGGVLVSRSSCPGLSPGRRHCIAFLSKTLYSHSASLYPGALMGTGERNAGVTL